MFRRLLLFLMMVLPLTGVFSQVPDYDQKMEFSRKVQKIRFWAYIGGDTSYTCYADAAEAIITFLSRKGYQWERCYFDPGSGISVKTWRLTRIASLQENEAFLEVRVGVRSDSIAGMSSRSTLMVQDPSGRVYAQHSLGPAENNTLREYTSFSEAIVYNSQAVSDTSDPEPFSRKLTKTVSADLGAATTGSLRGIPVCRNSIAPKEIISKKNGKLSIDLAVYGGYCAGSSMDVTGGKAVFRPGPDYGIEFLFDVYQGITLSTGYKREDTFVLVDVPNNPKEGELALSNNYMLIGGSYFFRKGKSFRPYLGLDIGPVNVVFKDKYFRDVWYFSLGGRAGIYWVLGKVAGLRLQSQLIYQIHPKNAPFLYSDNIYEMPHPVNSDSNLPQLDLSLGIVFRIAK